MIVVLDAAGERLPTSRAVSREARSRSLLLLLAARGRSRRRRRPPAWSPAARSRQGALRGELRALPRPARRGHPASQGPTRCERRPGALWPPTSTCAPATCRSTIRTRSRGDRACSSRARAARARRGTSPRSAHGPPIPSPHPAPRERRRRAASCSPTTAPAATRSSAEGGIVHGRARPRARTEATPRQIAEAVRIGPYVMPSFSTKAITPTRAERRSSRTCSTRKHPDDRGGWGIGHLGPLPEGMVTWLLAASVLVAICLVIGKAVEGVSRVKDFVISGAVLLLGRRRRRDARRRGATASSPAGAPERRAESLVLAAVRAVRCAARRSSSLYALDRVGHGTQWLGLALGAAFALLAPRCVVIARRLVVTEELAEPYPEPQHPEEQGDDRADRRGERQPLHAQAAGHARRRGRAGDARARGADARGRRSARCSTARQLDAARPWRRGRRLVDEQRAADRRRATSSTETFYTAYPEERRRDRAPLLVGSPPVAAVRRAAGRRRASSPTRRSARTPAARSRSTASRPSADTQPKPALVCPCHYSTFDPADGGKVLFGPAGRPLPQLPLVDRRRRQPARGRQLLRPGGAVLVRACAGREART